MPAIDRRILRAAAELDQVEQRLASLAKLGVLDFIHDGFDALLARRVRDFLEILTDDQALLLVYAANAAFDRANLTAAEQLAEELADLQARLPPPGDEDEPPSPPPG